MYAFKFPVESHCAPAAQQPRTVRPRLRALSPQAEEKSGDDGLWLHLGQARIRVEKSMDELGLPLSPREQEILLLTAQGQGVKAIARTLNISVHTVDTFRRRIYQKLGVSNAASAAAITLALALGARVEISAEK